MSDKLRKQAIDGRPGTLELSQKVKMRRAPEVRLIYDKAIEEQERVDEIFAKLRRERAEGTTPQ